MLSSTDKTIILSGALLGSVFLFTTSLTNINDAILRRYYNVINENHINFLLLTNGATMAFSAYIFSYSAYIAMK